MTEKMPKANVVGWEQNEERPRRKLLRGGQGQAMWAGGLVLAKMKSAGMLGEEGDHTCGGELCYRVEAGTSGEVSWGEVRGMPRNGRV